ncbi:uncharacterized protein LOC131805660 isoform X1 [Musca domestica]|uniref:Uncharacterized protein LOC131805660 isoform X1 n=1 Tax=Musca domestica TaxID=7370 RepID=A0ABM3VH32_MUSDO|nr:uncharacterized protein LOC131805660 isoform X1 [Musca domestica]
MSQKLMFYFLLRVVNIERKSTKAGEWKQIPSVSIPADITTYVGTAKTDFNKHSGSGHKYCKQKRCSRPVFGHHGLRHNGYFNGVWCWMDTSQAGLNLPPFQLSVHFTWIKPCLGNNSFRQGIQHKFLAKLHRS